MEFLVSFLVILSHGGELCHQCGKFLTDLKIVARRPRLGGEAFELAMATIDPQGPQKKWP